MSNSRIKKYNDYASTNEKLNDQTLFNAYSKANDRLQPKRAFKFLLSSSNLYDTTYNIGMVTWINSVQKISNSMNRKLEDIKIERSTERQDSHIYKIKLSFNESREISVIAFNTRNNKVDFVMSASSNYEHYKSIFPTDRRTATVYKKLLKGPVYLMLRDFLNEKGMNYEILENYRELIDNYNPSEEYKEI